MIKLPSQRIRLGRYHPKTFRILMRFAPPGSVAERGLPADLQVLLEALVQHGFELPETHKALTWKRSTFYCKIRRLEGWLVEQVLLGPDPQCTVHDLLPYVTVLKRNLPLHLHPWLDRILQSVLSATLKAAPVCPPPPGPEVTSEELVALKADMNQAKMENQALKRKLGNLARQHLALQQQSRMGAETGVILPDEWWRERTRKELLLHFCLRVSQRFGIKMTVAEAERHAHDLQQIKILGRTVKGAPVKALELAGAHLWVVLCPDEFASMVPVTAFPPGTQHRVVLTADNQVKTTPDLPEPFWRKHDPCPPQPSNRVAFPESGQAG